MSKPATAHRVPPYRRPIIIGGFLIILAIVIVTTVFICKSLGHPISESPNTPPNESVTPPTPIAPSPDSDPENKTPQYEGEDPNQLNELTGMIIYKDIDPETNALHSAVSISQYLQEGGQCVYNIKQGDTILSTASAAVTAEVSTSVCGPFSLPLTGLSPGRYQIEVLITGDGKQGTIIEDLEI